MPHHGVWAGFFFGFFLFSVVCVWCVCVCVMWQPGLSGHFSFSSIDFDRKLFNGLILWVFFAMIPFSAIAWLWTLVFSDSTTTGNTGISAPTAAPTAALADNGNQTTVLAPPNQTQKVTSISIVV